jgi:hypothetical protein
MTQSTTEGTEEAARHEEFVIIVNAEQRTVESDDVLYEQVVKLAYPTPPSPGTRYTVTYRKAKEPNHEGSLAPGQSVEVRKEGTIFNVKTTGKS